MSGLGDLKWRLAGMVPESIAIRTLASEQRPEAGSECPMFDLTDPMSKGDVLPLQNTSAMLLTSCGSPTC